MTFRNDLGKMHASPSPSPGQVVRHGAAATTFNIVAAEKSFDRWALAWGLERFGETDWQRCAQPGLWYFAADFRVIDAPLFASRVAEFENEERN